jgi:hypothetical protein
MEKIPYKPGDVLEDKFGNQRLVVDLSNNKQAAFLSDIDGSSLSLVYTKNVLDDCGYTLKTPKEEKKMCGSVWNISAPDEECERCDKCGCERMGEIFIHPVKTPTPWRSKINERYYFLGTFINDLVEYSVISSEWKENKIHLFNFKSGNCFRTREEAEQKLNEIMGREI